MYFDSLTAVIQMDGHGAFVWAAYAVTSVVIVLMLLIPQRRQRRLLAQYRADRRRASGKPEAEMAAESEGSNASGA